MATYSVKLVDHTGTAEGERKGIQKEIQGLFDQLFSGISDTVTVAWGKGATSDDLVLHFVQDVASSYIQQKMPGKGLKPYIAGHTRTQGKVTCTEFYKFAEIGGKRRQLTDIECAKIAVHESFHNLLPAWSDADVHGPAGGGGLALSPPKLPPTDKNKELIRRGFSVKTAQQL
jgi:hypothetical protein